MDKGLANFKSITPSESTSRGQLKGFTIIKPQDNNNLVSACKLSIGGSRILPNIKCNKLFKGCENLLLQISSDGKKLALVPTNKKHPLRFVFKNRIQGKSQNRAYTAYNNKETLDSINSQIADLDLRRYNYRLRANPFLSSKKQLIFSLADPTYVTNLSYAKAKRNMIKQNQ